MVIIIKKEWKRERVKKSDKKSDYTVIFKKEMSLFVEKRMVFKSAKKYILKLRLDILRVVWQL